MLLLIQKYIKKIDSHKGSQLPKISLDICFLETSEEFPRDFKSEFESDTVNEPAVFEPLKFYYTLYHIREIKA